MVIIVSGVLIVFDRIRREMYLQYNASMRVVNSRLDTIMDLTNQPIPNFD